LSDKSKSINSEEKINAEKRGKEIESGSNKKKKMMPNVKKGEEYSSFRLEKYSIKKKNKSRRKIKANCQKSPKLISSSRKHQVAKNTQSEKVFKIFQV